MIIIKIIKAIVVPAVLVGAIIVSNNYARDVAKPIDNIDGQGFVTEAIREPFKELTDYEKKKIVRHIKEADSPQKLDNLLGEAAKLFSGKGEKKELQEINIFAAGRFIEYDGKNLSKARLDLVRHYKKKGELEKLKEAFDWLLPSAISRLPNDSIAKSLMYIAMDCQLTEQFSELTKDILESKKAKWWFKRTVIFERLRYYNGIGDGAETKRIVEKINGFSKKDRIDFFKEVVGKMKYFAARKQVNKMLALADCIKLLDPESDGVYSHTYILMISGGLFRKKNLGMILQGWRGFKKFSYVKVPPNIMKEVKTFAEQSIKELMNSGTVQDNMDVVEFIAEKFPGAIKRYESFLSGEKWVRNGRKGDSPKPLIGIAHRPGVEVKIDGVLDEKIYDEIGPLKLDFWYSEYHAKDGPRKADVAKPEEKSEFYLFYSEKGVYVAAKVYAADPMALIMRHHGPFRHQVCWRDDCVEFFLDCKRDIKNYRQWVFTGRSAHAIHFKDIGDGKKSVSKIPNPEVFGKRENGYWVVEALIPYSNLPLSYGELQGRLVDGNIRNIHWFTESEKKKMKLKVSSYAISLAKILGTDHNPAQFVFFEFEK